MLNEYNTRDIAEQMEEHLDTPVSKDLVELIPFEARTQFIKDNYKWSRGFITDDEIKVICKKHLDTAKLKIKKRSPKNQVDKLFLDQKSKLWV